MKLNKNYENQLNFQVDRRRATVELIKLISDLWYENNIELVLFRNQLLDRNVSEILNLIEYSKEFVQKPISIFDTVEIAKKIRELDLPPAKLDIGKLAYMLHLATNNDLGEFYNGFTGQPDYIGFIADWRLIMLAYGVGIYQFKFDKTIIGANQIDFSIKYYLLPFTNQNADRTTRIEWTQNGSIRNSIFDLTGLNFPASLY